MLLSHCHITMVNLKQLGYVKSARQCLVIPKQTIWSSVEINFKTACLGFQPETLKKYLGFSCKFGAHLLFYKLSTGQDSLVGHGNIYLFHLYPTFHHLKVTSRQIPSVIYFPATQQTGQVWVEIRMGREDPEDSQDQNSKGKPPVRRCPFITETSNNPGMFATCQIHSGQSILSFFLAHKSTSCKIGFWRIFTPRH